MLDKELEAKLARIEADHKYLRQEMELIRADFVILHLNHEKWLQKKRTRKLLEVSTKT